MPFNYAEYQAKTSEMSTDQLQKEWENYTRQIAGGATSTATSVLFSPLTAGISLMGLGLAAPRIHNARKKREIIEKGLQERGSTHNTRSRDVAGSMALTGAISVATLGLAGPLADAVAGEAVGKGAEYAVAHLALDGVGEAIEHKHGGHLKKKAEQDLKMKAMQAQLANMSVQNGGQPQQQMIMNNGQMVGGQWVQVNGQMVWQQMPVTGGFQQPALTTGMAIPSSSSVVQSTQQIQWQQSNPSMQLPAVQYPQVQIPGQYNQHGQYTTVTQQAQTTHQQYAQAPPQYQPVQGYQQQDSKIQLNVIPNAQQQQQPDSKYHLHVVQNEQQPQMTANGFPNEKSAAYTSEFADGTMTPLPLYSQQPQEQQGHPTHIDMPAALTMEEEIAMLKFKLLQLEMEKRGMSATISGPLEICLDPPKPKETEKVAEQQEVVTVQDVVTKTEVTLPQSTIQMGDSKATGQPVVNIESHVNTTIVSEQMNLPTSGNGLSAPAIPAGRPVTPAPPQAQYSQPSQTPQYAQHQLSTPSVQTQIHQPGPQVSHGAHPQAHQRQNSLVPPPIPAGRPVSPAPMQQQYAPPATPQVQNQYNPAQPYNPAQQQQNAYSQPSPQIHSASQQQIPIYQPRPVNAAIQAPPQAPQVQQYNQQPYQQTGKPVLVQRQDSGYYSQAPTPMSRPMSSISSVSSISSPIGRHPSISSVPQYAPPPQAQQYNQYNPSAYNPQTHGRSQSVSSMSSISSPPPPAYFPPPPGQQPVLAGKAGGDYFGQVPQMSAPGQVSYQQWQQPPQQGMNGQMNYGPPPPIPGRM